jgi:predicted amidohydrolase
MTVLLSNCIGFCDNFMSVGGSAVWNEKGELMGQLGEEKEGLLIYNLNNGECLMVNGE